MKKYSAIFCFLLATVFVGVPSFFAFAGEQGTLGDSQVDYVFEESTGTLRYLDGSLPQSDADSDWWNMVYRWTDCPVLTGLNLGDYTSDAVQSESGSSQELLSQYYIGIRGAWNKDTADLLAGGEELWNKLTAGAVSTAGAEG